jgi:hypothetical protein
MLEVFQSYGEVASFLVNFGMLLVWIVYLHVFVSSYRRQKQANLLISVGAGTGLDSRCLVSNLSSGPLYIRSIILELERREKVFRCSVTEPEDMEEWDQPNESNLWTRQGPLHPGSIRDMGRFRAMLDHASRRGGAGVSIDNSGEVNTFWITVIADYGPEDLLVAAQQGYTIERRPSASDWLRPHSLSARQIRSRRERRELERQLTEDLSPPGP